MPSHNKRVGRRVWKEVWGKGQRTKAIGVGRKKKKEFSQELPREFTAKLLYMSWLGKMAKSLSIFLFLFFSFLIGLTTTRWSMGKYHVTLSQCHNGVTDGHRWSCHRSQSQCVTWLE